MTITSVHKPLEHTLAAIEALDLEPIKFKAMLDDDGGYGWSAEHAEHMAQQYKRYLMLLAKYPEATLAPEQDIDRFWHLHILDTRKYAADCDEIFGEFLHHFPYLGLRGEEDAKALDEAFARMQALMAEEFGEGEGASRAAAFCTAPPKAAAFCTRPPQAAAFCTRPPQTAAFCTRPPQTAAFCTRPPQAAFCTRPPQSAAFCTRPPQTAAFCTRPPQAAFCTRPPQAG
jgi:hypothetical protein